MPLTGPPTPSMLHWPEEPGKTLQTPPAARTVHDAFASSPPVTEQKSPFAPTDETEQNVPAAALHWLPLAEPPLATEQLLLPAVPDAEQVAHFPIGALGAAARADD